MKKRSVDTRRFKKLIEDIENLGYTFNGEEKEMVDTAKGMYSFKTKNK